MSFTTDRAIKKAYFTDLSGGHILEFQFTPADLDFQEGGQFADRVVTGHYFTDLVWISGRPTKFNVNMFIDRTQESYYVENYNQDPFGDITRFPNQNPKYSSFDLVNLVRGVATGNSSSGFATSLRKKNNATSGNTVAPSVYSASPHYKQTQFDDSVGVLKDLEAILYFVRPLGMKLPEARFGSDGSVNIRDYQQGRFYPPPMVRFYYGALWREGYIVNVKYNLSVMNKQLVPRRMDADIEFACTRWGYLNEVGATAIQQPSVQDIDFSKARF